jgi:cytochrome b
VLRLLRAAWARGDEDLRSLKPSLARTLAYLRRGTPRTVGHDPLGLWMVWLLWILVLLLGLTGWMSRLDAFWGDDLVNGAHSVLADLLMLAVSVHVLAVVAMSVVWRENLPAAMVTGIKRRLGTK